MVTLTEQSKEQISPEVVTPVKQLVFPEKIQWVEYFPDNTKAFLQTKNQFENEFHFATDLGGYLDKLGYHTVTLNSSGSCYLVRDRRVRQFRNQPDHYRIKPVTLQIPGLLDKKGFLFSAPMSTVNHSGSENLVRALVENMAEKARPADQPLTLLSYLF